MTQHSEIVPIPGDTSAGPHVLHYYTFASVEAMDALSDSIHGTVDPTTNDIGKVAKVGSAVPYDFYVLASVNPVAWEQINGSGGASGSSGPTYWQSTTAGAIFTTGSMSVTGSALLRSTLVVSGAASFAGGLSGSLTRLTNGSSFLVAGNNIFISTGSNGQVTIGYTGSNAVETPVYWYSPSNATVETSGSMSVTGSALFKSTLIASGAARFAAGLSGSLTKLTDGTSYLIAGTNVTISTGSNGAVTIAASTQGDVSGEGSSTDNALVRWDGISGTTVKDSNTTLDNSGNLIHSGTITMTGSLFVTGSADLSVANGRVVIQANQIISRNTSSSGVSTWIHTGSFGFYDIDAPSAPTDAAIGFVYTQQAGTAGADLYFRNKDAEYRLTPLLVTGSLVNIQPVGDESYEGDTTSKFAMSNHVHAHGAQTDATMHAVATDSANGFMSSSHVAKLDTLAARPTVTPTTGTIITLQSSDNNVMYWCLGSSMVVSCSAGVTIGTTTAFIRGEGCNSVTIVAASGSALEYPSPFQPKAADTGSPVFVTALGNANGGFPNDIFLVYGDLSGSA